METVEPKEIAVPITSYWWRSDCILVVLNDDNGVDEGYIFRFHGERKEYQPGHSALEASLSLKLDENKPSPDVVKFINDFGPLDHLEEYEADVSNVSLMRSFLESLRKEIRNPSRYLTQTWEDLDDSERKEMMRSLQDREAMLQSDLKRAEKMAGGPYERWANSYRSLRELQRIYLEWKATGDLRGLTEHLKRLEPRLVKRDIGVVWEFGFTTLFDALIGCLALSIVEGRSWKTCPNPSCRKVFPGKRKYCDERCREAYHNSRKSDPVGRERQRLYQTLRRRRENDLIDDATFEKVRRQLNKAQTVDNLKAIERKNSKLYARLKSGPTLDGGPRQYKD